MIVTTHDDGHGVRDVQADSGDGRCGGECDTRAERRKAEAEGKGACKPDGADGGLPALVDVVEELVAGDTAVAGESVHHARVARDGEGAAEVHAYNDYSHI